MNYTVTIDNKIQLVLNNINYRTEEALNEFLLLKLSGKIAEFAADCEFYENKYKCALIAFEKQIEMQDNENDVQYHDFLAWKFAMESRNFYQNQLSSIL